MLNVLLYSYRLRNTRQEAIRMSKMCDDPDLGDDSCAPKILVLFSAINVYRSKKKRAFIINNY